MRFLARGHKNIVGRHNSTTELTTEDYVTPAGNCIVGIGASVALCDFSDSIKQLASNSKTIIQLEMRVGKTKEVIIGRGSPGLSYQNPVSMVARTSLYTCDRTLMVNADKAASDLSREFIKKISRNNVEINCELCFLSEL